MLVPISPKPHTDRGRQACTACKRRGRPHCPVQQAHAEAASCCAGGFLQGGQAGNLQLTMPLAFSMSLLAWGVIEFPTGYKAAGTTSQTLDSIKWGADWLVEVSMHEDSRLMHSCRHAEAGTLFMACRGERQRHRTQGSNFQASPPAFHGLVVSESSSLMLSQACNGVSNGTSINSSMIYQVGNWTTDSQVHPQCWLDSPAFMPSAACMLLRALMLAPPRRACVDCSSSRC